MTISLPKMVISIDFPVNPMNHMTPPIATLINEFKFHISLIIVRFHPWHGTRI